MGTEFGRRGQEIDAVATGKRIQELRKKKGIRVVDISDRMGFFEPQAVYKWIRGDSLPTLQNMFFLSQILETTMEDIIRCSRPEQEDERTVNRTTREGGDGDSRLPLPLFFFELTLIAVTAMLTTRAVIQGKEFSINLRADVFPHRRLLSNPHILS